MATNITGLLTGQPMRPNPNASAQDWRMQFGQQQADRVGQDLRGIQSNITDKPVYASAQEKVQTGLANLDMNNVEDLKKLASIQMSRRDRAGAAQTASMIDRKEKETAALAQKTRERESLIRIAKAQGDNAAVDYLNNNGSLTVMASKLLGSGGQGKASTLSKREEELYDVYFEDIAPAAAKAAGLTKKNWYGRVVDVAGGRQKLAQLAEHAYENSKGGLTREQALLQVLQGPTSNAGNTVANVAALAQSNQGGSATPVDPFAGKKARTP